MFISVSRQKYVILQPWKAYITSDYGLRWWRKRESGPGMACAGGANENPSGKWLALAAQTRIRAGNGLRWRRKRESKREMACANGANENPSGKWLALAAQTRIRTENGLRHVRKAFPKKKHIVSLKFLLL